MQLIPAEKLKRIQLIPAEKLKTPQECDNVLANLARRRIEEPSYRMEVMQRRAELELAKRGLERPTKEALWNLVRSDVKGRVGDWCAQARGMSLTCVHEVFLTGSDYNDPDEGETERWSVKSYEQVAMLRSTGFALLTSDYDWRNVPSKTQKFKRKPQGYLAVLEIDHGSIKFDEIGLRFRVIDRHDL